MSPETAEPLLAEEVKTRSLDDGILREPARFEGFDFEAELKKAQNFLYATALTYMRDADAAEEIVQQVNLQAFLKIGQLREAAAFKGWLKQITVRRCLNQLTRRKDKNLEGDELLDVIDQSGSDDLGDDPAEIVIREEQREAVLDVLRRVHGIDREVLTDFYLHGMTIQQISTRKERPEGTVKRQLHTARKRCRAKFATMGVFPGEGN